MILRPNDSPHFFRHHGKFIVLNRTRPDKNTPNAKALESLSLTIFATDQSIVRDLVAEIIETATKVQKQKVKAFISNFGSDAQVLRLRVV